MVRGAPRRRVKFDKDRVDRTTEKKRLGRLPTAFKPGKYIGIGIFRPASPALLENLISTI
jgi:hypothetical protein